MGARPLQMARLSPVGVLRFVADDPRYKQAARLVAADHDVAVEIVGHEDIVGYAAYRIIGLHGIGVAEDFLCELARRDDQSEGSPIAALQKFLDADRRKEKPLAKHLVLAHVIKAFNLWREGTAVKRLRIPVDDPYPDFAGAAEGAATTGEEPEAEA